MPFFKLDIIQIENIFKLILSAIIGGVIGTERERRNRAAGFRTHILVTTGACLIMIISYGAFSSSVADPTRIAAQVVSGIGFLGAGSIMQNKRRIQGLTTAANIWVCGALGLAIGAGLYVEAITTTIIIMIVLTVLNRFADRVFRPHKRSIGQQQNKQEKRLNDKNEDDQL